MKLHHVAVEVIDLLSSMSFFQELGFHEVQRLSTDEEWIVFIQKDDVLVELIEILNKKTFSRCNTHLAFEVNNLELWLSEHDHLVAMLERYELRGAEAAYITGPNGEEIELIQSKTVSQ